MSLKDKDIVYVFKERELDDSIELKYSLRSLKNIPHRNVIIVGETLPTRLNKKKIIHFKIKDDKSTKYQNVINKYKHICDNPNISEDFILMNDDILVMKKIYKLPNYTKGKLASHLEFIYKKYRQTKYYKVVEAVQNIYPDGYSFNVHVPIIYNKKKLKHIVDNFGHTDISIRSLYGNYYNLKHTEYKTVAGTDDCKLHQKHIYDLKNLEDQKFLSFYDEINYAAKKYLNQFFNKPSEFEK